MHSVVLGLPRTDRGECVVVVEHLDRAIDIPMVGGTQGGVEDSAVFVDGDCSARIGARGLTECYRDCHRHRYVKALGDHVRAVAIGERERGARRGIPGSRQVIGQELLAKVVGQGGAVGAALNVSAIGSQVGSADLSS